MTKQKAILSYSRLPLDALQTLKEGFHKLGIDIQAILTHKGEENIIHQVFPRVEHRSWYSYRHGQIWDADWDSQLYEQLLTLDKATALPLVERYGPFEGGSIEAETRLSYEFSVVHRLIQKYSPDIILFGKTPESGAEYLLYKLAQFYSIPTYFTSRGIFGHSRTFASIIDEPLLDQNWHPGKGVLPICNLPTPGKEIHPLTAAEITKIRNLGDEYKPAYMRGKISDNYTVSLTLGMLRDIVKPKKFLKNFVSKSGPFYKIRLYRKHLNLSQSISDIDWGDINIYFPLHYQPELTSMPLGGNYVNQVKVIKLLSDALPKNGRVVVKDHLSSFSAITKSNPNFRPLQYYEWIKMIPKARLVSPHTPSACLQERCEITASMTGTAGLEAMLRNKPVFAFGQASYLNGPGVFRIHDIESIQTALANLPETEISEQRVNDFLIAMDSLCYHRKEISFGKKHSVQDAQRFHAKALLIGLSKIYR
jgi:hypothetical protein